MMPQRFHILSICVSFRGCPLVENENENKHDYSYKPAFFILCVVLVDEQMFFYKPLQSDLCVKVIGSQPLLSHASQSYLHTSY